MKLYKGKIPVIAQEVITKLVDNEELEIDPEYRNEAEKDLISIMNAYLHAENRLRAEVKDYMAVHKISYDQKGEIRRKISKEMSHPIGDKVMPFLASQLNQIILNSPNFEEVYADDRAIQKVIFDVLRAHNVNEKELYEEARAKLLHLSENSMEFQIRFPEALNDVRRKRGLL